MDINIIIEEIIRNHQCKDQSDILHQLEQRSIIVTQSSLSRRLKKLAIVKQDNIYVVREKYTYKGEIKHIDIVMPNMLVIHTKPGSAPLLASKIDELLSYKNQDSSVKIKGIIGTIAGDDSIFVALDQKYPIEQIRNKIADYLQE